VNIWPDLLSNKRPARTATVAVGTAGETQSFQVFLGIGCRNGPCWASNTVGNNNVARPTPSTDVQRVIIPPARDEDQRPAKEGLRPYHRHRAAPALRHAITRPISRAVMAAVYAAIRKVQFNSEIRVAGQLRD